MTPEETAQAEQQAFDTYQELKILLEEICSDDLEISCHTDSIGELEEQLKVAEKEWRAFGTGALREQVRILTEKLKERSADRLDGRVEPGPAMVERDSSQQPDYGRVLGARYFR